MHVWNAFAVRPAAVSATCCCAALCLAVPAAVSASGSGASIRVENAAVTALHDVVLSATTAGNLTELTVKQGVQVERQQLLARVYDADAQLDVEAARNRLLAAQERASDQSGVELAQKELELALSDLRRSEDSNRQVPNSVTDAKIEQLQLLVERERFRLQKAEQELKLAEIELASARTEVKLAEERLGRCRIQAPLDGTVVDVFRQVGEYVQIGEPLLRVLQTETLRVEAFVAPDALPSDAEGRPVSFQAEIPHAGRHEFPGRVTFVSLEANAVNGQVRIVAEIANPERTLRTGTLGTLIIHAASDGQP
jgi:multidrug resistance efflux pump